ncbi:MAG: aminotransferase class I/II-fold pyridoxal phosphate-dependent enzyme [Rubrobacteraceae bacterium]
MAEGFVRHAGDRHHGAHGGAMSRALGVPAGGFLDFSQNINPLGTPASALKAAQQALESDVDTYPDTEYLDLREALGGYLGVSMERVLPTNGGAEAIFLAARTAVEGPPGEALILEPTFSEYATAARAAGLEPAHRVVRRPEDGFRLDDSALDDLAGVGVVFLCNPNNPTGEALSRGEVLRVLDRVRESGAILVVDEAFADFAPEISVADVEDDHLYVARSFTKFFAIPGLRLGALVGGDLDRARSFQPSWSVNAIAAAAGTAAAREEDFTVDSILEVERLRRDLLSALSTVPGIEPYTGAANFLLLRGPLGLVEKLARLGVLVRGCEPFLGLGPEYLRVAVRGEAENRRLVDVLREAT